MRRTSSAKANSLNSPSLRTMITVCSTAKIEYSSIQVVTSMSSSPKQNGHTTYLSIQNLVPSLSLRKLLKQGLEGFLKFSTSTAHNRHLSSKWMFFTFSFVQPVKSNLTQGVTESASLSGFQQICIFIWEENVLRSRFYIETSLRFSC